MRRLTGVPWLVVLVSAALIAPAAHARAADGLVPPGSAVPGYRSAGSGAMVARATFAVTVPAAVRHAGAVGAAFRDGGRKLSFGVITASGAGTAKRALHTLGRGRRPVKLGTGITGLIRDRSTRRATDISVVFVLGADLGAVRLTSRPKLAGARAQAVAWATSLGARVRAAAALTPLGRALDDIPANGSVTPQLAVRVFSLVYGPIPGAPPVPANTGPATTFGTMAIGMVLREWNRLTAAQQAAISADLEAPIAARLPAGSSRAAARPARSPQDDSEPILTPDSTLQSLADYFDRQYHSRISGLPTIAIKVFRSSKPTGKEAGDAFPVNADGSFAPTAPAYCRVRVSPLGLAESNRLQIEIIAHEVFHCEEFALNQDWYMRAGWIIEGLATWASNEILPAADPGVGADSMRRYLATPDQPLFARTYDAVGFWGEVDQANGRDSLWAKLPLVMVAGGNVQAYAAAGGYTTGFEQSWASAAFLVPAMGAAWNETDPIALPRASAGLADYVDDDAPVRTDPFTIRDAVLAADPDRPLIRITVVAGYVRAGTGTTDLGPVQTTEWYCMGSDCTCPQGEQSGIPSHKDVNGSKLTLGVTGGDDIGWANVKYASLDDYCTPTAAPGIQIHEGSKIVALFTTGVCTVAGGGFHATASDNGWSLDLRIKAFHGFAAKYPVTFGGDPLFVIRGPGGPYSNRYPSPYMTPALGSVAFYPGGSRMLFGYEYAWNASGSNAILPIGKMTCKRSTRRS